MKQNIPVPLGHPDLVAAIAADILAAGPITFARFMELALYHPEFGYYMRADELTGDDLDGERNIAPEPNGERKIAPEPNGEDKIGWSGDYYTSFDVHPVFAQALAQQVRQIDAQLGAPDPFTVVEMGPGKGLLARDFLAACEKDAPSFFQRLRYVLIERSPAMIAAQRRTLAPWIAAAGRVSWADDLSQMEDRSVVGTILSNELVDAFPVHRVRIVLGAPKEVYVAYEDGRFAERLKPLTPEVAQYLSRLRALDVSLAEGYQAEINLQALAWMKDVARVLNRGTVLTIDYGHTAQDLYGPDRSRGTLLCYYKQMTSEDPYTRVGLQDMTAHVDFTALAAVGEDAGLHVTGFTNQMSFLMGLGVERLVEQLEPGSKEFQSVIQLLRPEGMGRTFKILIQHKGMDQPALDGLTFKPFFGSILATTGAR